MTVVSGPVMSEQLGLLRAAVDALLDVELSGLAGDELLELARGCEVQVRRAAAVQQRLTAELDQRNVAGELGYRSTAALLCQLLNLTRRQGQARVVAAQRFGPRRALTGEPLPALFPVAGQALAGGAVSVEQAEVIGATVHALPETLRAEHRDRIDSTLTGLAGQLDPAGLRAAGQQILACLHPDGPLTPDRIHRRDRTAELQRHPDGSGQLRAHLSPACFAVWETILEPLARQRPDTGNGPDQRHPGQRVHDGLEEAGMRLLRTAGLPSTAGVATTLIISLSLDQLETRAGQATTSHGGTISIEEALRLAAAGKALPVILSDSGGILAYGRTRRLASPGQRLALIARDRGCSFPGCRETAARSEVHHTTDWANGGPTDLDHLGLACPHDNNERPRQGWTVTLINGTAHWIPPRHLDPQQKPQRNRVHRN